MPTKFQLITELYDQTVQSVTGSYQSWTGFLRAACYNYKCPFDEQLLIYAQRPDATAVLEMERWNRQFGRWVNRGAKSKKKMGRMRCPPPATMPWQTTSRTTCKTCGSVGRTACWRNWTTSI